MLPANTAAEASDARNLAMRAHLAAARARRCFAEHGEEALVPVSSEPGCMRGRRRRRAASPIAATNFVPCRSTAVVLGRVLQ